MWRSQETEEDPIDMGPETCLTIPVGTRFQFKNAGKGPLIFLIVTMPPWPGPEEAIKVQGYWSV